MARPLALLAVVATLAVPLPVAADGEHTVVEDARATLWELMQEDDFATLPPLLRRARGVLIVPQLFKAGFIIGGEAGRGVLLVRDPAAGRWSDPAFFDVGSASLGLQVGISETQLVLVVMTEAGLEALLADSVRIGADASVAAGPVGASAKAATATAGDAADIYAYGLSEGLFAGIALEGGRIAPDEAGNLAFYGEPLTTREIVQGEPVPDGDAEPLRAMLTAVGE